MLLLLLLLLLSSWSLVCAATLSNDARGVAAFRAPCLVGLYSNLAISLRFQSRYSDALAAYSRALEIAGVWPFDAHDRDGLVYNV